MMNEERLIVAMQALGLAGTAYLNARDYAKERIQGPDITRKGRNAQPVAIIEHPDIRRSLLWMKSYVEGMRALNYYTAFCIDWRNASADETESKQLHGLIELLTPVCKAYTSDMGFQVCNTAIQVFGGYGYCRDYPVEQFTRDCRITGIYEGTNGIQAIDLLSRKIPMSGGNAFKLLVSEIDKTIDTAAAEPALKSLASSVMRAKLQMANAATYLDTLKKTGKAHDAFMNATPMLEIVGDTLLAWMHLWQAQIAYTKIEELFASKGALTVEQRQGLHQKSPGGCFLQRQAPLRPILHRAGPARHAGQGHRPGRGRVFAVGCGPSLLRIEKNTLLRGNVMRRNLLFITVLLLVSLTTGCALLCYIPE